ncbi:unnamed protein product [Phytophthora lilii]|uniref:Unnamed protein product n=1 Tax=Phytophthora lilii TaxID=2077276 RepID=A0A9W6TKH1_9STRA|nr:unnamed protein product [Phytophthora lilii]
MVPNHEGIAFYHSLVDDLVSNNIEPVLTLYHWDMPIELQTELDKVGWLDPSMIEHFAQYAELMYIELGGKVKYWATFNEPLSFVGGGYAIAEPRQACRARLMLIQQVIMFCLHTDFDNAYPLNASDPVDVAAAERKFAFDYGWWAEPLTRGDYPAIMRERAGALLPNFTKAEVEIVKGSYDLFMLNHYSSVVVTDCSSVNSTTNCTDLKDGWARDKGVDDSRYPDGASAPARKPVPAKPAPAPAKQPAAPAPVQASAPAPSVGGGLLSTVAEGFAFGTGSAIARHGVNAVVDSFSGSKEEPAAQPVAAAPAPPARTSTAAVCASDNKAFLECIDRNSNDVAACQFYLDALNQCKQQSMNL